MSLCHGTQFFLNPLTECFSSEQRSPTACKRSHHLHRAGGRQWRDPALHWERAGDGDGGGARWHTGHQVGLLIQMVVIRPGGGAALCPIHPHYPLSRKPLTYLLAFLRICIMKILILVIINSPSFSPPFFLISGQWHILSCPLPTFSPTQKPHTQSCWWT